MTDLTSLCELFQRVAAAHAERLKRKPIANKYAAVIDALYAG